MAMTVIRKHLKFQVFCSLAIGCLAMVLLTGFTTGKVTVDHPYTGEALPRPDRILVYDFSSDLSDIPASSPLRKSLGDLNIAQNPTHRTLSRDLGSRIGAGLAQRIRGMGLFAIRASAETTPRPGDIVIKGYFMAVDEGDAAKRMALGFGSGGAKMKVTVEGYRMTERGLRFLGSAESKAGTGKAPGMAVGIGTAVVTSNPLGLIVGGALKARSEATGSNTIDGAAKKITKLLASKLEEAFARQEWI